jgi:hypothetical protein
MRPVLRTIHLAAAAALAFFLYVPQFRLGAYKRVTAAVAFPALALSGFGVWQGQRVLRTYRAAALARFSTLTHGESLFAETCGLATACNA